MEKSGWEIKSAKISKENGGLFVTGVNHDSLDPLFKSIAWHINHYGIDDARYDFSGCEFEPGASEHLERMRARRK